MSTETAPAPGEAVAAAQSQIIGTVENGVIRLPDGVDWPDGMKVSMEPQETVARKTFGERYAKYIGIVKDAPNDLAENHDHYLYGTPKRSA